MSFSNWSSRGTRRSARPPRFPTDVAEGVGGGSPLRRWFIIGALVLLFIIAITVGKEIYTEWLWFDSLGFSSVYLTALQAKVLLFIVGAVVFFLLLLANLVLARRLAPGATTPLVGGQELVAVSRLITIGLLALSVFLSFIFGSVAGGEWDSILRFRNAQPFGAFDPLFGMDISFFVFTLPFYRFLQMWLAGALVVILLASFGVYFLTFSLQGFSFTFTSSIKGHLSALGAGLLLLFAWGYRLDMYELVYASRGAVYGAGFTDVNAQWPALTLLTIIAGVCAVLLLVNVFLRGVWLPTIGIGVWVGAAILVGGMYPSFVQRFQVEPNELERERPYLERNIKYTRIGFGLDRIEEKDSPAELMFTEEEIRRNTDTVNNIRLWDHRPLKDVYNQIQSIRLQYDFPDIDVDRYTINGRYRQVMLGVRELSIEKLAAVAQTWVNQRLKYTHGYGVAVSPVNEVNEDGLPNFFIKDVPPKGDFKLERPEIYYGEKTGNYVIVNTLETEFDYPKGDENVYIAEYKGAGGVLLNSYIRRLAYALQLGDPNIILSQQLTNQSRVLYYRNVQERVRHLAPFLILDRDPYIVVADGELFWIQDAYTVTDKYPYSERFQGAISYIRNSVKAVVNAYDGQTTFYIADPEDAMVKTYAAIFPTLFRPIDEMPASLRSHVRYPEDLFTIQAQMYRTYNMQDPQVFYNRENVYNMPQEIYGDAAQPMQAYYIINRLPGEAQSEFIIMLPFTPAGEKNNMIAWLAARADGDKYGSLIVFKFPKEKFVNGPMNVEAVINNEPSISAQLTLWNQAGSRVIRGNMIIVPVENSVLYVKPIFLRSEQAPIPKLERVVVARGSEVVMEKTLEDSLLTLFKRKPKTEPIIPFQPTAPGVTPTPRPTPAGDIRALAQAAQEHYSKAQEYLKAGNWAGYGEELKQMEAAIKRLAELTK